MKVCPQTLGANEDNLSAYILGTAQLGMSYGIANTHGQPDFESAKDIISLALDKGVSHFDTAQVYGTSEQVLGQCLRNLNAQSNAKIITKVAAENLQDKKLLEQAFNTSLQNIGVQSLYCFMLHHEEYLPLLDVWQGEFLQELQKQGKIKYLGISVYSPELALQALENPLIQIVQVPSSLFDRRFIEAGIFKKAKEFNKEIHIRSVFLQGVLCMPPEKLPNNLLALKDSVIKFQSLCVKYSCTPSQAALFWMQNKKPEGFLIFGAESSTQVLENMDIEWQKQCDTQEFFNKLDELYVPQDVKLLNPSYWNK